MPKTFASVLLLVSLGALAACSGGSSPGGASGTGGASATGGVGGNGGQTTAGSGGAGGGASGAGGATGGVGGSGGSSAPTDASADAAAPTDASADRSSGRDGNSISDVAIGDADGSTTRDVIVSDASRPSKPSAGCGKMNPPMGDRSIMTGGQTATFKVRLPAGYNATTPLPLGFGFHGNGNPACLPPQGECQGFPDLNAITVYPKSLAAGWEQATVLEPNITFFNDLVALMKNEYCVDENRIFIAGVSSGGQFIEHLTCRYGDWLWQTTAVAAGVVNAATMNCKGTPPILVIHGVTDMAGNYGEDVAALFAKRNGCSATPPAGLAKAKTDLMAAFNAMRAEHVCLDWDTCAANPVRFCLSSQITYSGLTHGWPKVGGTLISEFQATLK
jgi:polyhydroxybutyrate depolymerase